MPFSFSGLKHFKGLMFSFLGVRPPVERPGHRQECRRGTQKCVRHMRTGAENKGLDAPIGKLNDIELKLAPRNAEEREEVGGRLVRAETGR